MASWWGGAASGAAAGASLGKWAGPWGAIGGGILGAVFGGKKKPKIPSELKRLYDFQARAAEDLGRFSRSAPLSDRLEQTQLANDRGYLGQQQAQQRDQLYSLYNPQTMRGSAPNLLTNLGNQQVGQGMALNAQHLALALQNRRQALLQASGIAANAAGSVRYQEQPQTDFAGTFGGLAQAMEQSRALKEARRDEEAGNRDTLAAQQAAQSIIGKAPGATQGAGEISPTDPRWNPGAALGGGGGANIGYGDVQGENPFAGAVRSNWRGGSGSGNLGGAVPEAPFYGGGQSMFSGPAWEWSRQRRG